MLDRRFSAAELANHAKLPLATVSFFLKEGVLVPSIHRATGRGQGHVFAYFDVLGAMSLALLRQPNATAGPLHQVVEFWRTHEGLTLAQTLTREMFARGRAGAPTEPVAPCLLCVTNNGVTIDASPSDVMLAENVRAVFCMDARFLVEQLVVSSTEVQITDEYRQPGPSGRVPWAHAALPRGQGKKKAHAPDGEGRERKRRKKKSR